MATSVRLRFVVTLFADSQIAAGPFLCRGSCLPSPFAGPTTKRAISRSQNSARCQRARKIDSPANVVLAALSFVDAGGEALRDAEAVLDFAQGEQPAVGAQVPGIEPGDDRLAADR